MWSSKFDVIVLLDCVPLSFTEAGSPEDGGALPFGQTNEHFTQRSPVSATGALGLYPPGF